MLILYHKRPDPTDVADHRFGPLWLDHLDTLMRHMERWPADQPVRCHAEGRTGFRGRLPVPGIQKRATG